MSKLQEMIEFSKKEEGIATIHATVNTGFENIAAEECVEQLGIKADSVTKHRGHICFNLPTDAFSKVLELRSVDNLFLVVDRKENVPLFVKNVKEEDIEIFLKMVNETEWAKSIEMWRQFVKFEGVVYPTMEDYEAAMGQKLERKVAKTNSEENASQETAGDGAIPKAEPAILTEPAKCLLSFRVTCNRNGKHSFSSQEIACHVGGRLQDNFHWVVDLSNHHLEVLVDIQERDVTFLLALTESSLHRRNITHFGHTTLRATMCYSLLKLAEPLTGEIVMDPMTGSGSIPVEGSIAFPNCFYLCGDVSEKCSKLVRGNVASRVDNISCAPIDGHIWDVRKLPLKDSAIDVLVTDLPFGKRVGNKYHNRQLYADILRESARVLRPNVGRVVFLTADQKTFNQVYHNASKDSYWIFRNSLTVNIGGMKASVFYLLRTAKAFYHR